MQMKKSIFIPLFVIVLNTSCKKPHCENCNLLETNVNGDTAITKLGNYCDDELEKIKNTEYIASVNGSVTVNCE